MLFVAASVANMCPAEDLSCIPYSAPHDLYTCVCTRAEPSNPQLILCLWLSGLEPAQSTEAGLAWQIRSKCRRNRCRLMVKRCAILRKRNKSCHTHCMLVAVNCACSVGRWRCEFQTFCHSVACFQAMIVRIIPCFAGIGLSKHWALARRG